MRHFNKYLIKINIATTIVIHIFTANAYSQNSNTTLIGRWVNGSCGVLDLSGNIAYFSNSDHLEVCDISNSANPIELGKLLILSSGIYDLVISGNYAYIAARDSGLRIIDISNPASPSGKRRI